LGLPKALGRLLAERKFGFDVEWAVFPLSHSLFCVTARPAIGAPSLRLRRPANNGRWDTELLYTRSARKANAKTSHSLGFVRKVGSRVESHPPDVRSAVARHRFLSPRDIALPKTRGDCRCGARAAPPRSGRGPEWLAKPRTTRAKNSATCFRNCHPSVPLTVRRTPSCKAR
jgi:hypothetical protein